MRFDDKYVEYRYSPFHILFIFSRSYIEHFSSQNKGMKDSEQNCMSIILQLFPLNNAAYIYPLLILREEVKLVGNHKKYFHSPF